MSWGCDRVTDIRTNRDLYLAVSQLIAQHREDTRSLDEYLRALWGVAHHHRERAAFTANEFFGVLTEAFSAEPRPFEKSWRDLYEHDRDPWPGFPGFEARLLQQIVDLREMAESGQLADQMRYFGINAPRGSRWYNFDPCAFLECATASTFGGRNWEDEPQREGTALTAISWEDFRDFLGEGQWYE
jgi:hypothetical protein